MRRAFLLLLGVVAVTWLEYQFFPGHTYLEGDTQIYLPILERLDAPGFLSRDLVATHPNVTHTIYDEITVALHGVLNLDFRTALVAQQLLFRAAAIFGVFLLALSARVGDVLALLIAAILNLGATLSGPAVLLTDREPIPGAFAFGLALLAAGLMSRQKPLLAGLAGGVAVLYDPTIVAPFWAVIIASFIFDARIRHLMRPASTILVIFMLLSANLAQLQPGVVESQDVFSTISEPFANLQQSRTRFVWVGLWAPSEIWHYLALVVCGLWATTRIWPALERQVRWLFVALPLCGIVSVPLSALLLDHLRWSLIPQIQPARALLFTVAFSSLACAIAGVHAARRQRRLEACLWFLVVFTVPMNVRILDLFRFTNWVQVFHFVLALLLASTLVLGLMRFGQTTWKPLVLVLPVIAICLIPVIGRPESAPKLNRNSILEVANWADEDTWGSSMFLFPDAGRELYPGIFRAESRRALWVDWKSGSLVPYFESFAIEWWRRWQDTMQDGFSPQRLQNMLSLPIDYYALKRKNQLKDIRPVFQNREFVVYDSSDLRNARGPLRVATGGVDR
jgi:hypothetical protein